MKQNDTEYWIISRHHPAYNSKIIYYFIIPTNKRLRSQFDNECLKDYISRKRFKDWISAYNYLIELKHKEQPTPQP